MSRSQKESDERVSERLKCLTRSLGDSEKAASRGLKESDEMILGTKEMETPMI